MKNERGISLLEIVVSVALMAVILLFLSRGFMTSMFMSRQSDEYSAAARAARDKMEEIVSQTFRLYDRVHTGSNVYELQNDPKTGFPKTKLSGAIFTDIPIYLTYEFVGGRRIETPVTITTLVKSPVTSGRNVDPFGRLHPFRVYLSDNDPDNPNSTSGLLQGLVDEFAGEVVIITSELREDWAAGTSSTLNIANDDHVKGVGMYGGDLLPRDGQPDGFQFFRLPIDLNCDGDTGDSFSSLTGANAPIRYAVGVIVRWNGRYGPERHETWTIISAE